MKKFISLALVFLMLMSIVPIASAIPLKEGYYTYNLYKQQDITYARISNVDPAISGDVIIPPQLGGYDVLAIAGGAFQDCTGITKISFHIDSVCSYIYYDAFKGCTSLKKVYLPRFCQSVGSGAFEGCTALESISLNSWLTWIGDDVFKDCTSLKEIKLPSSIATLGENVFDGCSDIDVIINFDITEPIATAFDGAERASLTITSDVADNAFSGCEEIISVAIENESDVSQAIGESAFENCTALKSVIIDDVAEIKPNAFKGCTALESVTFSDTVIYDRYIRDSAFEDCSSLKAISLEKVSTIGEAAFRNCTALDTVTFSDNLDSIDRFAFENCYSLKAIELPQSVTRVAKAAFYRDSFDYLTIPSGLNAGTMDSFMFYDLTVKRIHFEGSREEWDALWIGEKPEELKPEIIVCCYNGPKENHTHNYTYKYSEYSIGPRCVNSTEKRGHCACGDYIVTEIVAPLGHSYTNYVSQNSATCTTENVLIAKCDYGCIHSDYKYETGSKTPHPDSDHNGVCDKCYADTTKNCSHICHKGGFFYKIALFFWKLFKINKECSCGKYHY